METGLNLKCAFCAKSNNKVKVSLQCNVYLSQHTVSCHYVRVVRSSKCLSWSRTSGPLETLSSLTKYFSMQSPPPDGTNDCKFKMILLHVCPSPHPTSKYSHIHIPQRVFFLMNPPPPKQQTESMSYLHRRFPCSLQNACFKAESWP